METIEAIDWKQMGVFTEPETFNQLLVLYIMCTLGFTVFYYMNKMFFPSIVSALAGKDSPYFQLSEMAKREYHSRNVADLHAIITAPLSFYVCFHVCDDPSQNIFSSQECLMKPQWS